MPRFWQSKRNPLACALAPIGAIYGRIAGRRMLSDGASAEIPVICVGNFVVGGAGKTPTAIEVARVCRQLGFSPGFLSRGYGGAESGPLLVALPAHHAKDVGDEALLLAEHATTVVSADRPSGAKLLAGLGIDVIVMDDGFQNPSLCKDLSLVVVDGRLGAGNGFIFPAGPLRAPLADQIRRADALVVLGKGNGGISVRAAARAGLPILRAHTEAVRRRGLKRHRYLGFAGIAEPRKFYEALAEAGAEVGFTLDFPDHHPFSQADCERILAVAVAKDLVPITTEKDRVRLAGGGSAAESLLQRTEVFPIRVCLEEPLRLVALVCDAIAAHGGAYRRGVPVPSPDAPLGRRRNRPRGVSGRGAAKAPA